MSDQEKRVYPLDGTCLDCESTEVEQHGSYNYCAECWEAEMGYEREKMDEWQIPTRHLHGGGDS